MSVVESDINASLCGTSDPYSCAVQRLDPFYAIYAGVDKCSHSSDPYGCGVQAFDPFYSIMDGVGRLPQDIQSGCPLAIASDTAEAVQGASGTLATALGIVVGARGLGLTNATRTFGQFTAADLQAAAQVADRNGLTLVGRALQKHSGRAGSVFEGLSTGSGAARNAQGMNVLNNILNDPQSTTQVLNNVTNIWDSSGRGVRFSNSGSFMGFLEPQ